MRIPQNRIAKRDVFASALGAGGSLEILVSRGRVMVSFRSNKYSGLKNTMLGASWLPYYNHAIVL